MLRTYLLFCSAKLAFNPHWVSKLRSSAGTGRHSGGPYKFCGGCAASPRNPTIHKSGRTYTVQI